MKCDTAQHADNGKELVIPRIFLAAGKANQIMVNMIRKGDKNLELSYVTKNGKQQFGIVRKTVNGQ